VELDGEDVPTGGMYGFLSVAIRVHAKYGGRVAVTWEGQHGKRADGRPRPRNFRFDLYPSYKGKDEEMDAERLEFIREMIGQEERLKQVLVSMGVEQYMGVGCEGDDVVGHLATKWAGKGETVYIYSGDSDLRQLVREGSVSVVAPEQKFKGGGKSKGVSDHIYTPEEVIAKHGVAPEQMAALKALVGGKDNLPGVHGIGKKSGVTLVNHYGSLNKVLRAAINEDEGWPLTPRLRALVAAAALDVILYYKVSQVRTDLPVERLPGKASQRDVLEHLRKYKFQSLAAPAELYALMSMGQS